MGRLPYILSQAVFGIGCGFVPLLIWQGKSANDILFWGLFAAALSMLISAVQLRWRGLPLTATVGKYRSRVRFLRNEVTRVSTNDDAPSG
jgi:hypothetical protein